MVDYIAIMNKNRQGNNYGDNNNNNTQNWQPSENVTQWDSVIDKTLEQYPNLSKNLVTAVLDRESKGNPDAYSPAGAIGLMQVMPNTARLLGYDETDLYDPEKNIQIGAELLSKLADKYGDDTDRILGAYNGGEKGVDDAYNTYGDEWISHLHEFKGTNQSTGRNHAEETREYIDAINKKLGSTSNIPMKNGKIDYIAIMNKNRGVAGEIPPEIRSNSSDNNIEMRTSDTGNTNDVNFDIPEITKLYDENSVVDIDPALQGIAIENPETFTYKDYQNLNIPEEMKNLESYGDEVKKLLADPTYRIPTSSMGTIEPNAPSRALGAKRFNESEKIYTPDSKGRKMKPNETSLEIAIKEGIHNLNPFAKNDAISKERFKNDPVASSIGTILGNIPVGVGETVLAGKTLMKVPKLAKLATESKKGKIAFEAIKRGIGNTALFATRSRDELLSKDKEVRDEARKNLAIALVSSSVSPLPEAIDGTGKMATSLRVGLQPILDGTIEAIGQKLSNKSAFDKEHLANTLTGIGISAIMAVNDIKGGQYEPKVKGKSGVRNTVDNPKTGTENKQSGHVETESAIPNVDATTVKGQNSGEITTGATNKANPKNEPLTYETAKTRKDAVKGVKFSKDSYYLSGGNGEKVSRITRHFHKKADTGKPQDVESARKRFIADNKDNFEKMGISESDIDTPQKFVKFLEDGVPTRKDLTKLKNGGKTSTGSGKAKKESKGNKKTNKAKTEQKGAPKGRTMASMGGYSESAKKRVKSVAGLDLPEAVEFMKGVSNGEQPKLEKIISRDDRVRGVFDPKTKKIILKRDLFDDPVEATRVFFHELGHYVDHIDLDRVRSSKVRNILGRIQHLNKFGKEYASGVIGGKQPLTKSERARLKRVAKTLLETPKKVDREIRKLTKFKPQEILDVWNSVDNPDPKLLEYIQTLSTSEKKSIVLEAMRGEVGEKVPKKSVITGKETVEVKPEATPEQIAKKYNELILKEARKRQLLSNEEITKELIALSKKYKGDFDENSNHGKYRTHSEELYADAFSALMTEPELVKEIAPEFTRGFFNYMSNNPKMTKVYDDIIKSTTSGDIREHRSKNVKKMFQEVEDKKVKKRKKYEATPKKAVDEASNFFVDKNHYMIKRFNENKKKGVSVPDEENPIYALEENVYTTSQVKDYVDNDEAIYNDLKKIGLNWDDLGEYLFEERVAYERTDKANPAGHYKELAEKQLDYLKGKYGEEKHKKLQGLVKKFRDNRTKIIDLLEDSQLIPDKLIKHLRDNPHYATFSIFHENNGFRNMDNISAGIRQQFGTLADAENPASATILKDIALIKASNQNIANKKAVDYFLKYDKEGIEEATVKNGYLRYNSDTKSLGPVKGKLPEDKDFISYTDKGKPKFYIVDKDIADVYKWKPSPNIELVKPIMYMNDLYRKLFTQRNIGFWMLNAPRDYLNTVENLQRLATKNKNLPSKVLSGLGLGKNTLNTLTFFPEYIKAYRDAIKANFGNEATPYVREMRRNKELIEIVNNRGITAEDKAFERIAKQYTSSPSKYESGVVKNVDKFFDNMDKVSSVIEMAPKIAGKRWLEKNTDFSKQEIGHIVRTQIGSPDFLRKGKYGTGLNNILLFSNAIKEGVRANLETMKDNKTTTAVQITKGAVIPALLIKSMEMGLFNNIIPNSQEMALNIPEHDKSNYYVLPLYLDKNGRTVYLRFPHSENMRVLYGVARKALNSLFDDNDSKINGNGILDIATPFAGILPGITPALAMPYETWKGMNHQNSWDAYRGRNVYSDAEFAQKDFEWAKTVGKRIVSDFGGKVIYNPPSRYRNKYDYTKLEKFLQLPGVQNTIGKFLKVSDYGKIERKRNKEILEKQAKLRTSASISDEIINNVVNIKKNEQDSNWRKVYKTLVDNGVIDKKSSYYNKRRFRKRYFELAERYGSKE